MSQPKPRLYPFFIFYMNIGLFFIVSIMAKTPPKRVDCCYWDTTIPVYSVEEAKHWVKESIKSQDQDIHHYHTFKYTPYSSPEYSIGLWLIMNSEDRKTVYQWISDNYDVSSMGYGDVGGGSWTGGEYHGTSPVIKFGIRMKEKE